MGLKAPCLAWNRLDAPVEDFSGGSFPRSAAQPLRWTDTLRHASPPTWQDTNRHLFKTAFTFSEWFKVVFFPVAIFSKLLLRGPPRLSRRHSDFHEATHRVIIATFFRGFCCGCSRTSCGRRQRMRKLEWVSKSVMFVWWCPGTQLCFLRRGWCQTHHLQKPQLMFAHFIFV